MIIRNITFVTSSAALNHCPPAKYPEYAFTGRSNVGKSSLINYLVNRKRLAYTSTTPGKTQLINHFLINGNWYLADLPGYGYAKTSKKKRQAWSGLIREYILNRENLMSLFVLIDSRHPVLSNDMQFISFLGSKGIPFVVVFTKTDKISAGVLEKNLSLFRGEMLKEWEELPRFFTTSATNRVGGGEILDYIEETNPLFKKNG
ncbi:MAG: YihA family ribosome biogenesis GTP-binding protein [Chlorobi bacterium]|nr:YihA family ribosome biogenesis GTP-binding protein [Chlorobiota bacterium]